MDVSPPFARVVSGREERRQFRPPQRLATRVYEPFPAFKPSVGNHRTRARHRGFCFDVTDWAGARDLEPESRRNVPELFPPVRSIASPQAVTARKAAAVDPSRFEMDDLTKEQVQSNIT
ncbi:hypothetical protein IscW_ISCW008597 [Ixodes scapularis]|uniref:Uncharacterized protein n=1 Tax=Ixodes scapularis TaxID=6945 RepID=B7Q364_IXOSC|nr:hypothetical protein IscW_ISCW008597 [Ixodes scapularis]|eukprot:XP_002411162.1 hypothetical protein IscW_ISCW008597 [Ixodes scapularis]